MKRVAVLKKKTRIIVLIAAILLLATGGYFGYHWYEEQQKSKAASQAAKPRVDDKLFAQFAAVGDDGMSKEYYTLLNANKDNEALDAVKKIISKESDQSRRDLLVSKFEGIADAVNRQADARAVGVWVVGQYPSSASLLSVAEIFAKSGDYSGALKYAEQSAALATKTGDKTQRDAAQTEMDIYKRIISSGGGSHPNISRGKKVGE